MLCRLCGDGVSKGRTLLGYTICLECGEEQARQERLGWCVAPMHKSNYMLITDKADLSGLNNKGGVVK
jgi:hypothetical protein